MDKIIDKLQKLADVNHKDANDLLPIAEDDWMKKIRHSQYVSAAAAYEHAIEIIKRDINAKK